MKSLYQTPETTIVLINSAQDLMQYEINGKSVDSEWGNGANSGSFEDESDDTFVLSAPSLWDE